MTAAAPSPLPIPWIQIGVVGAAVVAGMGLPAGLTGEAEAPLFAGPLDIGLLIVGIAAAVAATLAEVRIASPNRNLVDGVLTVTAGILLGFILLNRVYDGVVFDRLLSSAYVLLLAALILVADGMASLSRAPGRLPRLLVPLLFGALLVYLWEVLCLGFAVPSILLPTPSAVLEALIARNDTLLADFYQTVIRSALPGYLAGCGLGFLVAAAIERSPFLQRGLLPVGSLVSAMPIVGIAPIMVMWFGFDWHSKAAVVVVMTFFPMLVNTLAGLQAAGAMERDLMRSYAAGNLQTLVKLRLPMALPYMFNALKLNSTLALIGAIVAEFFGTPIVGMGFRISTEVARLNVDIVWATIAVAALAGSSFYGGLALLERATTFWHPSQRR